jgi:hypothetical protein
MFPTSRNRCQPVNGRLDVTELILSAGAEFVIRPRSRTEAVVYAVSELWMIVPACGYEYARTKGRRLR